MGKETDKIKTFLAKSFPGLKADKDFKITSDATPNYNCIAWAYQIDGRWMQPPNGYPHLDGVTYWPEGATESTDIQSLVEAFKTKGYEKCDNECLEEGFMKVALYWNPDDNKWTHAARQHRDGTWTSKMGRMNDIQHGPPEVLESDTYGKVFCIMKRKVDFSGNRKH